MGTAGDEKSMAEVTAFMHMDIMNVQTDNHSKKISLSH